MVVGAQRLPLVFLEEDRARDIQCRTPDIALNSMRLDRVINEAQVGTGIFHLLGIEVFAKRDQRLLRSVIGQAVETHSQFMTFVIRNNIAR